MVFFRVFIEFFSEWTGPLKLFRSMFSHYFTRESQTARVEIHDYDPEALLVMIQWFYSGRLLPLDEEIRLKFLVITKGD
jgi:hypothetical protein